MQNKEPMIIRSKRDLDLLLRRHSVIFVPRHGREIKLRIEGLNEGKVTYWQKKINRLYHSCGCSEGALFLILGAPLLLGYLLFFSGLQMGIANILLFVLSLPLLAITGKLFGIISARIRLRRCASMINSLIEITETAED